MVKRVFSSLKDAKRAARVAGIKGAKILPVAIGRRVAYMIAPPPARDQQPKTGD